MNLPTRAQRPSGSITRLVWLFVLALFLVPAFAQPASALRICTYNLLNYDNQLTVRDPAFRTVMTNLSSVDVLAVQEVQDQTAMNNFLNNVLNVVEPGQWAIATFFNDPSQSFNQGMFYRINAVDVVLADTLGNSPRDIAYYTVRPDGYASSAAEVTLFSHHFKAGSSGSDQSTRQAEADRLRLFLNTNFSSTDNFILLGDFNMRSSTEGAYQELTQSQANNDGRLFDPINTPGTWYNNFNFRFIHTQSTRTGSLSPGDGGASGGMDDRFDIILTSSALDDGNGLDQIESTYEAYGQDGSHFNAAISDAPTIPEGQVVADALERASDHLPVFMDFQVPAIASADASLNFGTVIVGATANQTLNVTNIAVTPADDLDYDLTPSAGFTAPGGTFMEPAGGGNNMHTIGMDTGTAGNKNGDVTVASNDVD
ncbi:MAG: choice-of-anchor D domain-containing protein, partial [Candidatus Eisenbacteria bacterium]|nr:choice-of-anchor D domain-containing protein [Candidatus Eisenbacteria bacterium]